MKVTVPEFGVKDPLFVQVPVTLILELSALSVVPEFIVKAENVILVGEPAIEIVPPPALAKVVVLVEAYEPDTVNVAPAIVTALAPVVSVPDVTVRLPLI